MSFLPYVSPDQGMKDKSEYAHKGIARGRSVIGLEYADGLLFIAENPSATLHKISEIYDQIAFAGVGKYSEFEDLRISGIRLADLRGYSYGREDVKARDLANAYSQALSTIFTQQWKPYEVEILVGEVNGEVEGTSIYHVLFDGSVTDEHGHVAIGGHAEELTEALTQRYESGWDLATAVRSAVEVLGSPDSRTIEASQIEAGVLDRNRTQRRKFRRLADAELSGLLGSAATSGT
jgi:proteasome alpha subunit